MWTTLHTPVGELRLTAADGALVAVDFLDDAPLGAKESASAQAQTRRAQLRAVGDRADHEPVLAEAVAQLSAYFRGDLKDFALPLAPAGTPFQQRVWIALRDIGYGETRTYGEIARSLGLTGHGARAVGVANGRNPLPIVVPCHRVVGRDGSLTGYGGGVERKRVLLALEQQPLL